MKCFLILLVLISKSALSQNEPTLFFNKLCTRSSNNIGESKDINLKLSIPCQWIRGDINIPHGIFKYTYKEFDDVLATETLVVANLGKTTDEDSKYLITEPGLRLMTKGQTGKYVSFKSIVVDGIKGGEVILENDLPKGDGTYLHYSIEDCLIYDRKIILIQYTVTSKADLLCKKYLIFFGNLLSKTKMNTF
jgi:hypothetical protein